MHCEKCDAAAIISTNNGTFCKEHFIKNFERLTLYTIEKYALIRKGDTIGVANSGGKDSLSLLYIISKYFRDTNKIVSITIDEGIEGYRNKTIETMKHFCAEWGVQYRIYSYKEYSGMSMDKITRVRKGIPCSICGVFRRQLLNSAAKENRVDKLATAHNMDDEAESVIMNLFQNDFEKLIRLGPTSGLRTDDGFVSRIKPFIFINEKETAMFAFVKGINALHTPCPYSGFGFRGVIAKGLRELETTTTGAKRNIVNRMLELKAGHATIANSEFLHCSICGAPSSGTVCGACAMKRELANKA